MESFEIDGYKNVATYRSGVVVKVERQVRSEVHGSGYVVGTSSGAVGRTAIDTTHTSRTKIWLSRDDGKEEYLQVYQDIPVREGHNIQLMFISGHYVGQITGYDQRDRPIWERKSNVLLAVRIAESGEAYLCEDLRAAISCEDHYQSFSRLFTLSLFLMPAMGAGLLIWAWLLVRRMLLAAGSNLYGIPQSVAEDRWSAIVNRFEHLYAEFKNGKRLMEEKISTASDEITVAHPA